MTTPREALEQIIAIPNRDYGSDWDEIEEAREIARKALASLQGEDAVERVARTICHSGKFETGQGTCALICMDQLGDVRKKGCGHCTRVHGAMARAVLATGLVPDEAAVRAAAFNPTDAQINSACLSFRHDYGLLDDHDRERLRFIAVEWLRAWQKEGFGCDRDEVIERCAAVVDQCNREGPYEAIASAKRIRALKSAAIRSGGGE